jgi:hypothetical protein
MGVVMVKCPRTGHAISTGMQADRSNFQCLPVFFSRVFCPVCNVQHEWFAKDAWVRELGRRLKAGTPQYVAGRKSRAVGERI